jgi:hypothetical protein
LVVVEVRGEEEVALQQLELVVVRELRVNLIPRTSMPPLQKHPWDSRECL